jgi:thymidine kinase
MKNEFVLFVGPMFGSKTTKMLAAVDRLRWQKRKYAAFKPKVDNRYGTRMISTHNGGSIPAFEVSTGADLLDIYAERNGYDIIAVDEAFMISGVADVLIKLFKQGKTVLASSLQLSSDFTPYEEMQKMMPYATKVEMCPAVCSTCGADAHYTKKIGGRSDHKIEVGGAEMYQPKCLEHFCSGE